MNLERPKPTVDQVNRVFRNLADRHAEERSRLSAERSWSRISTKRHAMLGESRALRLLRQPSLRVPRALLLAATLLLAVGGAWRYWPSGPASDALARTLSYDVERPSGPTPNEVRQPNEQRQHSGWIKTAQDHARISFSDGSLVDVGTQSALRLEMIGEHSARAELLHGHLTADIVHADSTNWVLHAGPYRVEVIGTRFDLGYDNAGFSLAMHAGRVRVLGPDAQSWTLDAGQQLRLPVIDEPPVVEEPPVAQGVPEPQEPNGPRGPNSEPGTGERQSTAPAAPATPLAAARPHPRAGGTGAEPQSVVRRDEWPQLVAKGQFERVVEEAKALGDAVPTRLTERELTAVAQAAGYTGETRLAERCWRFLRQHFAPSPGASKAAFYLARIAEHRGDTRSAMDWLEAYSKESPSGAFAAEALGRRLLLLRRGEGARGARAREAAREYLRRFPEGAYREAAQSTLESARAGR
jgi:FecR protein